MTAGQYEKISAPFRDEKRGKALKFTNKLITAVGYASYPAMLIYIFFTMPHKLMGAVIVPASGFVLLTFVRRKINRPRPYETLDIKPLIYKDTKGKSLPSRHVFSMTVIAVTAFLVSVPLGMLLIAASIILAVIRVIGGVHYPLDVTAGFVSAVVWGGLLYTIIF